MGLFGPSKLERATAAAEQRRLEQERAEQASRGAAQRAEDKRIGEAEQERFDAAFVKWLDLMSDYQLSTHAPRLTDQMVTVDMIMPIPSTRALSRMGRAYYLAGMRSYANSITRHYEITAVVAKGEGAMSFWQDVREYVEGALLQPGL